MADRIATHLKQRKPFASDEEEILVGLQMATGRVLGPWAEFVKTTSQLTPSQYNVLRILRGSHPTRVTCSEIVERMITRDPDVTRLLDRLARRGLVDRLRSRTDRRVVQVGITPKGLELLATLDPEVRRLPKQALSHMSPARLRQLIALLENVLAAPEASP